MNRFLLVLFVASFIFACTPEPKELSNEELSKEKSEVVNLIKNYNKANEEENFSKIVDMVSKDIIFFGTDSGEVIKDIPSFKKALTNQWELFDFKYGEMIEIDVQMDKNATFASAIFGIPTDLKVKDKTFHLFLRIARTLKKENSKWVIVSGVVSMVGSEQSNELSNYLKSHLNSNDK